MTLKNKSLFFINIVWYNEFGDNMGKYSLIVENTLNNKKYTINVFELESREWKSKVHIKDIDNWTSSFEDKDAFLKYLYDEGIIDFRFGNTYIITKFKDNDIYYKNIYHSKTIGSTSLKVEGGFIDTNDCALYSTTVEKFFALMEDIAFDQKLGLTKYINPTLKTLIKNYRELKKTEIFEIEQLEQQQYLLQAIKNECRRYKTFRGIVLFLTEYQKEYEPRYVPRKKDTMDSFINKQKNIVNTYQNNLEEKISGVERYNREFDEFLSEEEYKEAYQGNEHQHRI